MTIADTIKSLKPGDRVRVTREQLVDDTTPYSAWGAFGPVINHDDPTITSIELIERPLQVGDRVTRVGMGTRGTITAADDGYALVSFDPNPENRFAVALSDLRRAS